MKSPLPAIRPRCSLALLSAMAGLFTAAGWVAALPLASPPDVRGLPSDPARVQGRLLATLRQHIRTGPDPALVLYPPETDDPPGYFPMAELDLGALEIGDLRIHALYLQVTDFTLDAAGMAGGPVRLQSGRVGRLQAEIRATDLALALVGSRPSTSVEDVRVRLDRGRATITGRVRASFLKPLAKLTGRFAIAAAGRQIQFIPESLTVAGLALGTSTLQKLARKVNPVLDLTEARDLSGLDLRVGHLVVDRDRILVNG